MTTYKLTPNDPHDVTGLVQPVMGWQFSEATIGTDVLEGARRIQTGGWTWDICPNPDRPNMIHMSLLSPNMMQRFVEDTQWFTFDGVVVAVLDADTVTDGYAVEVHVPPPLPEPEPEPEPLPPPQSSLPIVVDIGPQP